MRCNLGAAVRHPLTLLLLSSLFCSTGTANAQDITSLLRFLAGGAAGLGLHESGHLAMNVVAGSTPGLDGVKFGPVPFFAITHEPLSPAREFAIASAGFWTQHLTTEVILATHPRLRDEHAPVLKGILAFNVLASAAYAGAAFGRIGPAERDTRGMAASAGIREPVIGVWVLTPAVLDAARYFSGDPRWARWLSRAIKVGGVLLVVRARAD
jgi:hypothetical protein